MDSSLKERTFETEHCVASYSKTIVIFSLSLIILKYQVAAIPINAHEKETPSQYATISLSL